MTLKYKFRSIMEENTQRILTFPFYEKYFLGFYPIAQRKFEKKASIRAINWVSRQPIRSRSKASLPSLILERVFSRPIKHKSNAV